MQQRIRINRLPLSEYERALIRMVETQPWTDALRGMVQRAVEARGIPTSRHDSPGDLVEALEDYTPNDESGPRELWSCSYCGPHPRSSRTWCAAGCGRDYNRMERVEDES